MVVDIHEIVMDMIKDPETQVIAKRYHENFQWGIENLQELKEEYGGTIVLILGKQVLFAFKDVEEARKRLAFSFEPSLRFRIAGLYIPKEDEISFYG